MALQVPEEFPVSSLSLVVQQAVMFSVFTSGVFDDTDFWITISFLQNFCIVGF